MAETYFSPCPRGLEQLLVEELGALGGLNPKAAHGGVEFSGDWALAMRVNLESRIATRVLWKVAQGRYRSEEDVYRLAYAPTWAKWFEAEQTIRVYVTAQKSPLRSLDFVTLKIKDAVCDHFRTVGGRRPSVDTRDPDVRVHAFLARDTATFYLDTSGEPLYKRGFKRALVEAPLKENLAAGILRLAGWDPAEPLVDPMCGSGTFLLEAAQMALDIAPGLGRSFAFERLRNFDAEAWESIREAARQRQQAPRPLDIYGADISADQIARSQQNLDAAGLGECAELRVSDLLELEAPLDGGVMVCNPPYGVRLSEKEELAAFYPQLADALKRNWAGWRCYFFSGDTALPKLMRLKASKRTPLFNGALECRLYEYLMVAGGMRDR